MLCREAAAGIPGGVRECLRARFEHPYRTFAPVCLTLARAKSISEHPYRTFTPTSISEHPYRTCASPCFALARAKSVSEIKMRPNCVALSEIKMRPNCVALYTSEDIYIGHVPSLKEGLL